MSTKEKNMDARIAFGNSLSEKRRESGFSQEELGLKIGKSSNAVSRYENAENTMDVHTFAKTVNALKANEADGWRGRNVWYPGRSVRYAPKGVTTVQSSAERTEVSRGHSSRKVKDRISRSLEYDWERRND